MERPAARSRKSIPIPTAGGNRVNIALSPFKSADDGQPARAVESGGAKAIEVHAGGAALLSRKGSRNCSRPGSSNYMILLHSTAGNANRANDLAVAIFKRNPPWKCDQTLI